jgi:hypothetical protein
MKIEFAHIFCYENYIFLSNSDEETGCQSQVTEQGRRYN